MDRAHAESLLVNFHAASDSLNANLMVNNFFTDDAFLRYGNSSIVRGKEKLRKNFSTQLSRLQLMKHHILHFDMIEDRIYLSCKIDYLLPDDDPAKHTVTLPAFGVFRVRQVQKTKWLIASLEVYLDQEPLHSRVLEKVTYGEIHIEDWQ